MDGLLAQARFNCPSCDDTVVASVEVPSPDLTSDHASEWTAHGVVDVECPSCGVHFAGQATVGPYVCALKLDEHPDVKIKADASMYDDDGAWDDYEPPDDPFYILTESFASAKNLLGQQGGPGGHLVNRLVFAHLIGAFEAFLADTLIRYVNGSPNALARLIQRDKELKDARFTLAEIEANPDLTKDIVRARLRRQIWHNLRSASALYNKAFDIDLLAMLGDDLVTLEQAIVYRHDCVHRNGYDCNGIKIELFTPDYIEKIHDLLKDLALEIMGKFDEITAKAFFIAPAPEVPPKKE